MKKNALVFGALSDIAGATIDNLAARGYNLYLLARDLNKLNDIKNHLTVKYPSIEIGINSYDAINDTNDKLIAKIDLAYAKMNAFDLLFIAHGNLPNQELCITNWNEANLALQVNGISAIEICHNIANRFKAQKSGTIAVISSVAALRGRQSNYIYGAAKGILNIYLQGLRNSLQPHNINVLTILPGFVSTKMTKEFKKGILWASPEKVATDIISAIDKKKDVIYTPFFWKYIMLIICSIPEKVFKKLKL